MTYANIYPALMVDPTDGHTEPVVVPGDNYAQAVWHAEQACQDETEGAFWTGCYPIVVDIPRPNPNPPLDCDCDECN